MGVGEGMQDSPYQEIGLAQQDPSTIGSVITANMVLGFDEADMNEVDLSPGSYLSAPEVNATFAAIKAADPTRPIYQGFGKCFSVIDWNGCQAAKYSGNGESEATALAQYCQNADIVTADYYADDAGPNGDAPGHNYLYGQTVQNIQNICGPNKVVGFYVETGNEEGAGNISTSDIAAATWDGIMHGAHMVVYFVDDFNAQGGQIYENGLLQPQHQNALTQVTADNQEIHYLAPWLNAPSQPGVTYTSTGGIPITTMLKTYNGNTYLLAMADGNATVPTSGNTTATITLPTGTISGDNGTATVYNENRTLPITNNTLTDTFTPYQLHVYQLP
jgi:hypothetical protein